MPRYSRNCRNCSGGGNRSRYQRGGSNIIDLSYGGKMWNLSSSKKVDQKFNRIIIEDQDNINIQIPISGVSSPDIIDGIYTMRIRGPILLNTLLVGISSVYREFAEGTIKSMVDGHTKIIALQPINSNTYQLILQ